MTLDLPRFKLYYIFDKIDWNQIILNTFYSFANEIDLR